MNLLRIMMCVGLFGTSAIIACSSDPTTTPAGDDDDDSADAGKSSSSSSSSSSSGSPTNDAGQVCHPEGTYVFGKPTYTATGGTVCDNYAASGNANATAGQTTSVTLNTADAGVDGVTYVVKNQGAQGQTVVLLAADKCQLGGGEVPTGQHTVDANDNPIDVKLSPSDIIDFDTTAGTAHFTSIVEVESDPTGAAGTPCTVTVTTDGTKQ